MRIATTFFALWAAFALGSGASTAESNSENAEPITDVRKPVEPSHAAATLAVPKGFRAELVAAEPLIRDPMAMEFDENGIAYVLEIPAYNEYGKPLPHTPGSIARLEDTDGDGRFDCRTTFASDLKYPSGLFCYDGGLFVGDAPDLLYLKDTNGDGKADKREVLYTGFGAAQAGESQINSFRWGLDNRIHLSTGLDGGEIRPANQPNAPPRTVRNRRILLEPRSRTFELTSGGGQHGMSFDDWGHVFVSGNSTPIDTISYDDRYIERNPLMSAPSAVISLGPGEGYTKLARISPDDAWRVVRSELKAAGAEFDEPHEEGRASGVITSATGVTIYRGNAWPDEYRNNVFFGEVANNVICRALVKTTGLKTSTHRDGAKKEFIASTDTWFRPAQFAHGPDGNLCVIDIYRELIEGIQWVPAEVLAKMDPTAGSDRGRIYRIVREDFKQPPPVRLGQLPISELVEQLGSRNGWHRDTSARLIYELQNQDAVEPLRKLLAESEFPQARVHSLYALDGLAALGASDITRGLADSHPRVREHATRLAERFAAKSADVRKALVNMVDDPNDAVRLQLAFSLGSLPLIERIAPLLELLRRDGASPLVRMAIQSSLSEGAAEVLARAINDNGLQKLPHAIEFAITLADQVGRAKNNDDLSTVVSAIDALDDARKDNVELAKKLTVAMLAEGSGASADVLSKTSHGRVKKILDTLLADARETALNTQEQPDARLQAINVLACGSFNSVQPALDELLTPQQDQSIQESVVKVLGRFSDSEVAQLLLDKWPGLTPALRSSSTEVLLSRPEWAILLLSAVEHKQIAASDFEPSRIALLKAHPTADVRDRAAAVFAASTVARRADVVNKYQAALRLTGDAAKGKDAFKKTCAACHQLEGEGTVAGADLNSIRDQGREAILLNILDPNREINPKFLTYSVTTNEGRVITGMIAEETPNNLTVRQADSTLVPISRIDIDEMQSTGMSYMPEGLESQLDHQAMADLLTYLMSIGTPPKSTGAAKK